MEKDPRQLTNLAEDPAHAEVMARMRQRLEEKVKEIGTAAG